MADFVDVEVNATFKSCLRAEVHGAADLACAGVEAFSRRKSLTEVPTDANRRSLSGVVPPFSKSVLEFSFSWAEPLKPTRPPLVPLTLLRSY